MMLRRVIFLRISILFALLIASIIAIYSFICSIYVDKGMIRLYQTIAHSMAPEIDRLSLWDDRVAIKQLLVRFCETYTDLEYVFVEKTGHIYEHTFNNGVPKGLLQFDASAHQDESVREFRTTNNHAFYDIIQPVGSGLDMRLHLGVSKEAIGRYYWGIVAPIVLIGFGVLLVGIGLIYFIAKRTTKEIEVLTCAIAEYNKLYDVKSPQGSLISMPTEKLITTFQAIILDRKRATEDLEKATEAANVASQAKSSFLAAMSHDLRTPLNAVIGFSELLLIDPSIEALGLKQKECIRLIAVAGRHLLNLVEGLLNLSVIESGRIALKKEMIDLKILLDDLSKSYAMFAEKKGVKWLCDIRITKKVIADKHRLIEVINNLVNNAIKYTPTSGSITLGAMESGGEVTIFVKDTGVGIEENNLERIFVPFEQAATPGVSVNGTSVGLGLSISRKLVELQGGTLTVESTIGKGSCFNLTLPDQHENEESGST